MNWGGLPTSVRGNGNDLKTGFRSSYLLVCAAFNSPYAIQNDGECGGYMVLVTWSFKVVLSFLYTRFNNKAWNFLKKKKLTQQRLTNKKCRRWLHSLMTGTFFMLLFSVRRDVKRWASRKYLRVPFYISHLIVLTGVPYTSCIFGFYRLGMPALRMTDSLVMIVKRGWIFYFAYIPQKLPFRWR